MRNDPAADTQYRAMNRTYKQPQFAFSIVAQAVVAVVLSSRLTALSSASPSLVSPHSYFRTVGGR